MKCTKLDECDITDLTRLEMLLVLFVENDGIWVKIMSCKHSRKCFNGALMGSGVVETLETVVGLFEYWDPILIVLVNIF